jgi:hypothetical protein
MIRNRGRTSRQSQGAFGNWASIGQVRCLGKRTWTQIGRDVPVVELCLCLGTDNLAQTEIARSKKGGPMKPLRVQDLLRLLRRDINRVGGQSEWARQTGICRTYINRVLNGRKPPGPSIWRALGFKRAVLRDAAEMVDSTSLLISKRFHSFCERKSRKPAASVLGADR